MSAVSTWSTTAADNNSAAPNGFPEGMNPSDVNNSNREMMAAIATWRTALDVTTIELGHASDTTMSRPAAGRAQIEGREVVTAAASATTLTSTIAELNLLDGVAKVSDTQLAVKTADETVTTSTTVQDDDHLTSIPIAANTTYLLEMDLFYDNSASGGFKHIFVFSETPQGSAGYYSYIDHLGSAISVFDGSSLTATTTSSTSSSTGVALRVRGYFTTHASNSGTVKLQWAQNTSDGTTIVRAGTSLKITRVY